MEFLNIAYISKVNVASLNGSEGTGGNITPVKKITDSQGEEYCYISGQALRRYLKDTLMQLGERISAVDKDGNPSFLELDSQIFSKKKDKFENESLMYKEFCDMDLFGYMFPKTGRRRWSPVKVSPLVSILPYKGEYDYLTRKRYTEEGENKSGDIVQIEIDTLNFMRGNVMVDAGKIGMKVNEYTYKMDAMLSPEEISTRRNKLIDALKFFNGGAKQARNLEDISPKFVVAVKQKTGNPFLLNLLKVDKNNNIETNPIIQALEENKDIIMNSGIAIGVTTGIFGNEKEIKALFEERGFAVKTVSQALDSLKVEG